MDTPLATVAPLMPADSRQVHILKQLERKLLWLSSWMIHNANHIRPNRDGLKVGGHQASCASVISIMAALYFEIARPQDRIAVKPHAGPVFHDGLAGVMPDLVTEIVRRCDQVKGFVVLPKRWIVERTIGWLNRCRRLAKDWENLNRNALAFLRLASIRLMLRKLCNPS